MKTIKQVRELFDKLDRDQRMSLLNEFANFGIADREVKFYRWLRLNKKV